MYMHSYDEIFKVVSRALFDAPLEIFAFEFSNINSLIIKRGKDRNEFTDMSFIPLQVDVVTFVKKSLLIC